MNAQAQQGPGSHHGGSGDDLDVVSTAFFGAIGAVLVVIIILAVQGFFYAYERQELERKVVQRPYHELVDLRARQQEQLHSYRWLDPKAGTVTIPIERAIELTASELGGPEAARAGGGGS